MVARGLLKKCEYTGEANQLKAQRKSTRRCEAVGEAKRITGMSASGPLRQMPMLSLFVSFRGERTLVSYPRWRIYASRPGSGSDQRVSFSTARIDVTNNRFVRRKPELLELGDKRARRLCGRSDLAVVHSNPFPGMLVDQARWSDESARAERENLLSSRATCRGFAPR
jgi:hypothetical protein